MTARESGYNRAQDSANTQGRVTVAFRGNWAQATDLARTDVQDHELMGVA